MAPFCNHSKDAYDSALGIFLQSPLQNVGHLGGILAPVDLISLINPEISGKKAFDTSSYSTVFWK